MAITTGVVRDAPKATGVTLVDMTAERGGAALLNGSHDATLLWRQRLPKAIRSTVLTEDVGQLQGWSHAQKRSALTGYARSSSGLLVARTVLLETKV